MDFVTSPPIENFLIDAETGRAVVVSLRRALDGGSKILVWGPRVGAIEIVEDLFELWPASGPIVAVNAGAMCTRTREHQQDSGWVNWAEADANMLLKQAIDRHPHGVALTMASEETGPMIKRAMSEPDRGFVTSIPAGSADEASSEFAKYADSNAIDMLVEVRLVDGQFVIGDIKQLSRDGTQVPAFTLDASKRYIPHSSSRSGFWTVPKSS